MIASVFLQIYIAQSEEPEDTPPSKSVNLDNIFFNSLSSPMNSVFVYYLRKELGR